MSSQVWKAPGTMEARFGLPKSEFYKIRIPLSFFLQINAEGKIFEAHIWRPMWRPLWGEMKLNPGKLLNLTNKNNNNKNNNLTNNDPLFGTGMHPKLWPLLNPCGRFDHHHCQNTLMLSIMTVSKNLFLLNCEILFVLEGKFIIWKLRDSNAKCEKHCCNIIPNTNYTKVYFELWQLMWTNSFFLVTAVNN